MVPMLGIDLPLRTIRAQVASAVNIVVQLNRLDDGSRRVTSISEITGMEGDVVTMQDIFLFKQTGFGPDGKVLGKHEFTGNMPKFVMELRRRGVDVDMTMFKREESPDLGRFVSRSLTRSVTLSSGLAHAGGMSALILLADGSYLSAGEAKPSKFNLGRNQVVHWSASGEELRRALDFEERYRGAAVSPDGELIALVLGEGRIEVRSSWCYR